MQIGHEKSHQMSVSEITEVWDTCDNFNSADAQISTDRKQQMEIDLVLRSDTLQVEVAEVVDALHQCAREVSRQAQRPNCNWRSLLPDRLSRNIRKLLSKEGLEELPSGSRQEARLRILEAIGLCLNYTSHIVVVDTDLVGETELSSSELLTLYRRLGDRFSTNLKNLEIAVPANASKNWEAEKWLVLADILLAIGAQAPEEVFITDMPLSTLSKLAKAVAASYRGPIPVRRVRIDHGLQDLQRSAGTTEAWAGPVANLNVAVPNLKELRIEIGPFADDCVAKLIGEAATSHQSLETLRIVIQGLRGEIREALQFDNDSRASKSGSWGYNRESFAVLVRMLKTNSMPALKHLTLQFSSTNSSDISGYFEAFDWPGFYASLTQVESVSLGGYIGYRKAEPEILEWIKGSKALQELNLGDVGNESIDWRSLFTSLRDNNTLRVLRVRNKVLDDDAVYRALMEMLQVNSTLQEVEFEGTGPREAAVREALSQDSYLAELRQGNLKLECHSPKYGRVFLCGSPESGKTLLTRTMVKVAKGKLVRQRFMERLLRRTEGVEIHTLRNDDDMQILLWDLAGHDIFRALQQFLFPKFSTASVFIYVFSPFSWSEGTRGKKLKPGVGKAFENELLQWLRSISSNSAVLGINRPRVMVVISHTDVHGIHLRWAERILARIISDFQDVIHVHPRLYLIDGNDLVQVKPIVDEVYSIFRHLPGGNLFRVPTACSQLSQELVRWASRNPREPVIDDQTFFSLCGNIPDLRPFSMTCNEDDSKRLLKAVGFYLQDVGTIVDMTFGEEIEERREEPKSNLIVVNPNWLTHVFLGYFIGFRQEPEEDEWAKGSVDGLTFMRETELQQLLLKHLEPMKKHFPKLTWQTLRDLMENLDLLYVIQTVDQNSDFRFFIPTILKRSEDCLRWHQNVWPEKRSLAGEVRFLGVRFCCKDPIRTYICPSFFCKFQVMMWHKFMKRGVIECSLNLISILSDEFEIFIENDEAGDFIDVLIRSNMSHTIIWKCVESIVKEMRDFCASFTGPHVELGMHIVRTECVRRLTPCKHRRNQSVSRKYLNRNLMISVQKLGPVSKETDLYSQIWNAVPEANLEAELEKAIELLPPDDVREAYALMQGKAQSLQEKVVRLTDVMMNVDTDSEEVHHEAPRVQTSNQSQQIVRKSPDREKDQDIKRRIPDLKGDVKEGPAEVWDMKLTIREMNLLHRKETENLTQMHYKLNQLMGRSMFTTEWPKMPYFTSKDVTVSHRITAVVEIGKPLMLHFQCEERIGHHFVREQPGYKIIVQREKSAALSQISKTSVKVIYYLLKAGLHGATGLGDAVPELQTADGSSTLLTSLSMHSLLKKIHALDRRHSEQHIDHSSPEVAWRYLQGFLASNLKSRISEYFLLYPVEYLDRENTQAWLCGGCLRAGLKGNKLKRLHGFRAI